MKPDFQTNFDLDSALAFMAAIRHGNLRGAADDLKVSQSTISRKIGQFEEQVGAKLIIRRPEGVLPTDVGRKIQEVVGGLDDITKRLSLISAGLKRDASIVFTGTDGVAGYWLPILLAKFPEDNPGINLKVRCRETNRGSNVTAAESDVDVTYYPPDENDVYVLGKATMPLRMFGSPSYLEQFGAPETLDDVAKHRACIMEAYLSPGLGGGDWARYAEILATHDRIVYEVNSALALGFAIRSGWGLGVQPALTAVTEPGMVMLPEEVYLSSIQFWLVAHKDVKDNPAPRLLAQWIKDHMIRSFKDGKATFEVIG